MDAVMTSEVFDLKTDQDFLKALREASQEKQTTDEILEQRVSFVYSSMKPEGHVTKAEIRRALVEKEGASGSGGFTI